MKVIEKNNLKGISYMLINAVFMAVLYASIKHLTKDLSSNLVVFIYKFLIMVLVLPVAIYRGGLKTKVFHIHFIRGFASVVGALFAFYALKHINLTDVTALGFLEQVLLMILGIILFGERFTKSKVVAILLSIIGALLIVYKKYLYIDENGSLRTLDHFPLASLNEYHILVFLSVVIWALNRCMVRLLGRTERTDVQMFYVSFFSALVALPWAFCHTVDIELFGYLPIKMPYEFISFAELPTFELHHIFFCLLLVLCYGIHSISTFKALQCADLSVIAPFEYSRLIFSAIIGYFIFSEGTNFSVYLGCFLIMSAGILMIRSERRYGRQANKEASQNIVADEV
jgi:drug/metabolite transporter (DMT)-like permease